MAVNVQNMKPVGVQWLEMCKYEACRCTMAKKYAKYDARGVLDGWKYARYEACRCTMT